MINVYTQAAVDEPEMAAFRLAPTPGFRLVRHGELEELGVDLRVLLFKTWAQAEAANDAVAAVKEMLGEPDGIDTYGEALPDGTGFGLLIADVRGEGDGDLTVSDYR